MKILLGIYQRQEEMKDQLNARGIEGKDIFQVGPFTSHALAVEWMEFMEQRLQPSQIEKMIVGHLYPNTWFGTAVALE